MNSHTRSDKSVTVRDLCFLSLAAALMFAVKMALSSLPNINLNALILILVTVFFGFVGYVFYKLNCEGAPLLLGFVLGPMLEENMRRALLLSRGDPSTFFTSPISCALLMTALFMVLIVVAPAIRKKREVAFRD